MGRDILRDNIDCYQGSQALKDWSADRELYDTENAIIVTHFPPPPARILDLGCGAGRTTIALETRGYDVDALDLADNLVEEARTRVVRSRIHLMDARELTFAHSSFDAAFFSFNGLDCVYPSKERERVLAEVFRVLRPGGVFYYSAHNGIGSFMPRPGDSWKQTLRRNRDFLRAQRRPFDERTRYLAYPEWNGTQVLYSAPPHVHLRELREAGYDPVAVYGARGPSYRQGPHVLTRTDVPAHRTLRYMSSLALASLTCSHLHYVARRPE